MTAKPPPPVQIRAASPILLSENAGKSSAGGAPLPSALTVCANHSTIPRGTGEGAPAARAFIIRRAGSTDRRIASCPFRSAAVAIQG